jgi:hypothetical protein
MGFDFRMQSGGQGPTRLIQPVRQKEHSHASDTEYLNPAILLGLYHLVFALARKNQN